MGKTYRRDQSYKRPKKGKDLGEFKKSKKFKTWDEKPIQTIKPAEPSVDSAE